MANVRQVIHGFDRPNIRLSVERCDDQQTKQRTVLLLVQKFKRPGIVYVATRGHAEEIAAMLTAHEQPAVAYHAGLPKAQRTAVQDDFMNDRAPLIVATNAFGMGVDKPDVRFVIHYDIPEALDAYYQEVGRAGRDGEPAEAVLLYREEDLGIRRAMAGTTKITAEQVKTVAETIESKPEPVKPADIKDETGLPKSKVTAAIQRLEDLGVVEQLPGGAVQAGDDAEIDEAAEQAAEEQERYRGQRQARVELMKAYAETSDCRRRVLLGYFGEEIGGPCGHCDNCETGKSAATEQHEQAADHPFALNSRVKHKELGEGLVLRYETGNIVVLFDEHGTKSLVLKYVVDHGLLSVA
jgi:ATP-dependent DNA helicase RecQ